jgi:hypothetical protein
MKHFILTTIAAVILVGCSSYKNDDKVELLSEKTSPNGKFIATSFSCSGGGAAGYFYYNANLRRGGEELDQRDCLLGKHKTWMAFNAIQVRWMDDSNLEISYKQNNSPAYQDNNSVKISSKYGVAIHYVVKNQKNSLTQELKAEGK